MYPYIAGSHHPMAEYSINQEEQGRIPDTWSLPAVAEWTDDAREWQEETDPDEAKPPSAAEMMQEDRFNGRDVFGQH